MRQWVGCGQILQRGGAVEISGSDRGQGFLRSREGAGFHADILLLTVNLSKSG